MFEDAVIHLRNACYDGYHSTWMTLDDLTVTRMSMLLCQSDDPSTISCISETLMYM